MGYEHLSITTETEFDEVTESNAENLLPIPSECEVTLEDKSECDLLISKNYPVCDNHYDVFSNSKIDDDISVYDDDFEDIEYVEASLPDPEIKSIFFLSNNSIPPGIENVADDPEKDIRFLEELLIDDSIPFHDSSDSNFEDNQSIPRPPPEPPDDETDAAEEILRVRILSLILVSPIGSGDFSLGWNFHLLFWLIQFCESPIEIFFFHFTLPKDN
nr:hypothetical protein [Tanacetum cinerariifolium]